LVIGSIPVSTNHCLYKDFIEPLRPFYALGRKVLLMFRIERRATNFSWYSAAALACFAVSVLAALVGSLLTSGLLLNAQIHPWLYDAGLIMLILALPILILGGHCLDLLDQNRQSSQRR
jgi:hypothetical protein